MSRHADKIYSATYSNVPVYELVAGGVACMRRRSDDWINATHILKVAEYDKPARTRILEREVQKGVHEKVQGGYGKYQGTWIPLPDGRELAAKNGVLEKLRPIFDFVPGDRSPPPAPKHATAASKPRQPRAPAASKRQPVYAAQDYDQMDLSVHDGGTPDDITVASDAYDDFDNSNYPGSRKRRRTEDNMSQADREHRLWAEELLDYFMLQEEPEDQLPQAPQPPPHADLDRPIDDKGHTALHWAAAMGDLEVVKDLIRRGANVDVQSTIGQTPLMRAVCFTNNYDRRCMDRLAGLLIRTVSMQEWFGQTVFHHIAKSTQRKSKYECARYYMECILNKMHDVMPEDQIAHVLDMQDNEGDTAVTIAARNGARKCVRSLIGRSASVQIPNQQGETADNLIIQLNHRRQERHQMNNRQLSSSPFQPDNSMISMGGAVQPRSNGMNGAAPIDPMIVSQQSLNSGSNLLDGGNDVYKSESALALTSSIMPVIFNKARNLAVSIESEVAEKEAELAEAERVVAMRRHEIDLLKRQADELRAKEQEQLEAADSGNDLVAELDALMRECAELTEEEMNADLKDLIEQEEQLQQDDTMMDDDDDEIFRQKADLVRRLQEVMKQRQSLFETIVESLSVAGLGDKHAEYKRLITGALGVREEDVESMMPEIVAELEDAQLENVGGA
ncbi:hypothetical protein PRZ48_000424 [Zasmidium cellare]|uniref:HTH APSES-type domain-containing protein n=1 Tax=Zasmidium cellare TaxID=395010 RepID=A0ABR0F010_ZASCE|nr:hypothetical protein PRZ48_000424 [Zasmidium cellare]